MSESWGILGPEFLPNQRRVRTLKLGASIRLFNDLAVPGLGGVWYGKQLLLATLGVAVAEEVCARGGNVQNIKVANAIEALACWLAFKENNWQVDARLLGRTKLQNKDVSNFKKVQSPNFYVSQPMRMAAVQALPALGLVTTEGTRFNSFSCSDEGRIFVEAAVKKRVIEFLVRWVLGKEYIPQKPHTLCEALSPLIPLEPEVWSLLRERLLQGGREDVGEKRERRQNALAWVEDLRKPNVSTLTKRPPNILADHWQDIQAGAALFKTREAAIALLEKLETYMGNQAGGQTFSFTHDIPKSFEEAIKDLQSCAKEFLAFDHYDQESNKFCAECAGNDHLNILKSLVKRDGVVLRLVGDEAKPGPAFRGSSLREQQSDVGGQDDDPANNVLQTNDTPLPDGISYRLRNLYLLNLDMKAQLDDWLRGATLNANP